MIKHDCYDIAFRENWLIIKLKGHFQFKKIPISFYGILPLLLVHKKLYNIWMPFFFILTTSCSLWAVSSQTGDWTPALTSERTESKPLNRQEILHLCNLLLFSNSDYKNNVNTSCKLQIMCFLSLLFLEETQNRLKYWIQFDTVLLGWRKVGSRTEKEWQEVSLAHHPSWKSQLQVGCCPSMGAFKYTQWIFCF